MLLDMYIDIVPGILSFPILRVNPVTEHNLFICRCFACVCVCVCVCVCACMCSLNINKNKQNKKNAVYSSQIVLF